MTVEIPAEHKEENLKLSADGYVDLFHIQMRDGTNLRLRKEGDTVDWQGHTWEGVPISFTGYELKNDGQVSRPKFRVVNPNHVFTAILVSRDEYGFSPLDKATIYRYRVLRRDIEQNRPVYQLLFWTIWNITNINTNYVEMELRNAGDGNNFYVPYRRFVPPEFPTVSFT